MKSLREFQERLSESRERREMRKSVSRLGFAVFDSVHYVPADVWSMLVPAERRILSLPYLAAIEASRPQQREHRYAIVYDGRQPVAAAVFTLFELSGDDFGSSAGSPRTDVEQEQLGSTPSKRQRFKRALEATAERHKGQLSARLLLCGNQYLTGDHGFFLSPSVDATRGYHALAELCYRLRRAEKLAGRVDAVLIKDFYADQFDASAALETFGYRCFSVDPNMVVHLDPSWKSFDDYLAAMTSKYRQRARSVLKKGKALQRRSLSVAEIETLSSRIDELYRAVHHKAEFRIVEMNARYFASLKEHLGDDFELIVYEADAEVVGFTTTLYCGADFEGHAIGLDYAVNTQYAVYQNILYDDIRLAIERRSARVVYGRTALEMKTAVGARPLDVRCYLRLPNPVSNRLARPLFRYVKQTDWTPRNPFGQSE